MHLDDYYESAQGAPQYEGGVNWDHPNAIRFLDVKRDIDAILGGSSITFRSKSELYNPGYLPGLRNKIAITIAPHPLVILEGHLALYDAGVREKMSLKIFLSMDIQESVKRRTKNKIAQPQQYVTSVLYPAHAEYVEPSSQYADVSIDVANRSPEQVIEFVAQFLKEKNLL